MRHAAKAILLASTLAAAPQTGHAQFAITVSAFNCTSCSSVRIVDNATGDLDPAVGVIAFDQPVTDEDSTAQVTGRATDTVIRDVLGGVTSVRLELLDTAFVSGGGIAQGIVDLEAGTTFQAASGISTVTSVDGEFRDLQGGVIQTAFIALDVQLRRDGRPFRGIGFVQPPSPTFNPSPVLFTDTDPREIRENLGQELQLLARFMFHASTGDGVFLDSGKAFVLAIPEPSTLWLSAIGLVAIALRRAGTAWIARAIRQSREVSPSSPGTQSRALEHLP